MPKTAYFAQVLGENSEALMAIREVPHFRHCSQALLDLVYRYGRIFSLSEGERLTRENEFDQWVFFLISGRLAVMVGEERVDTISSSLVGERCLLGEARRATLSATEEGVVALGVDMALLDSLADEHDREDQEVLLELLSIIAGEVVNRIAYLATNQIEMSARFSMIQEGEGKVGLINRLAVNEFVSDPRVNMEIFKFLQRANKDLLAQSRTGDGTRVDTARIYSLCINQGRYEVMIELAAWLHQFFQNEKSQALSRRGMAQNAAQIPFAGCNFHNFSRVVWEEVNSLLPAGHRISETMWGQMFRVDDELTVDMPRIGRWLRESFPLSIKEAADVVMAVLREASAYTSKINSSIKEMVKEMSETALLSRMEDLASNPEGQLLDFLSTRSPEEMIPLFSKHILQVHLVSPFLEGLGLPAQPAPPSEDDPAAPAREPGKTDTGQSMADSLFD